MPELVEPQDTNDKIASRLNNQEEVFPNNLDTMSAGEVAETLTNIIAEGAKITPESGYVASTDPVKVDNSKETLASVTVTKAEPKATRARKATPAVGKPVDTATVIEDLRKQAQKAHTKIEVIEWIDECVNVQDMPADMDKPVRDILLQYAKELESVRAIYIQKIQSL